MPLGMGQDGSGDLKYLAKVLASEKYNLVPKINRVKRAAALATLQTVITRTPFDTGRAKNNWLTTVGSPSEDELIGDMGDFDRSGQAAISKGDRVIASVGDHDNGSIYITNNLPYINRLNQGWSKQAPAGFVQMSIKAAVEAIKNARLW